jgi:class I fructose-bisphosphate aldolase
METQQNIFLDNLNKLTTNGKTLLLAYDQGIEHGPVDFDGRNIEPSYIIDLAAQAGFNGVILQKGVAEKYFKGQLPLVLKLNGRTRLRKGEPLSLQVCSVKEAKDLGAIAVGYTIYLGSEFEPQMLKEFGRIEQEAEEEGLIVIGWMYPRGKSVKEPNSPETVAYAARAGLELGADFVKINYPGSVKALSWAIKAAGKTRVLVSGGDKLPEQDFFRRVKDIMSAGAAGLAVGRNIWQAKKPLEIAQAVKEIVFAQ